ncbi:MAG: sigma-70 family RNA polymerase sigma factor [Armatimonadetes bacterium]|nr:sigma-70 family RNA polymerase sigma factor [Armatimonadota bacterium]
MSDIQALRDEQDALVLRYLHRPRPELKDMILVQYSGLVERIARRFSGLESQDDLVQVGYVGLLNALGKYDPNAGVRFNTYATHLIAGEMKHYLRDRTQTIRQPAWLQELRHKVNRSVSMLQANLGRVPTVEEVAVETGISTSAVEEVFQTQEMLKLTSLDQGTNEEDGGEVDNLDSGAFCKEQLTVEDRVVLEDAMKQLRDIERDVLTLFHFDALNQTEIAHRLGISCNYVSHILRQSLGKLRRILTSENDKEVTLRQQTKTAYDDEVLDSLTGLYNETYFGTRLQEELHRSSSTEGMLGLVRIDFKGMDGLRSYYGQASVDDLLLDVSEFLKENVRRIDVVCRVGDHGFAVILCCTALSAQIVAHRMIVRFNDWASERRAPMGPVKCLLGAATYPANGQSVKALFNEATPTEAGFKAVGVNHTFDQAA